MVHWPPLRSNSQVRVLTASSGRARSLGTGRSDGTDPRSTASLVTSNRMMSRVFCSSYGSPGTSSMTLRKTTWLPTGRRRTSRMKDIRSEGAITMSWVLDRPRHEPTLGLDHGKRHVEAQLQLVDAGVGSVEHPEPVT